MQHVHPHAVAYRPLAKSVHLNGPLTLVYRATDHSGATALFVEIVTTTAADMDSTHGAPI
jgi:hypothetical protein